MGETEETIDETDRHKNSTLKIWSYICRAYYKKAKLWAKIQKQLLMPKVAEDANKLKSY
jgi:hypothetical protein